MKETIKNWFETPYKKYNSIAGIGAIFVIVAIIILIANVKTDIDLPSWFMMFMLFLAFAGVVIFIFAAILGFRASYKEEAFYDEREKKYIGKASYYSIFITIVLSTILIYIIDFLKFELTNRTLIMIPITILCVSGAFLFWYFKRKGDVK